jgi:hypothetical protein
MEMFFLERPIVGTYGPQRRVWCNRQRALHGGTPRALRPSGITEDGENMNLLRRGIRHVLDAYTVSGGFEFYDGLNDLHPLTAAELATYKTERAHRSAQVAIKTYVDQIMKVDRSHIVTQEGEELPGLKSLTFAYARVRKLGGTR